MFSHKMAHDPQHLTDTYKEGFCSVCGISGVNQYYGIKQSYIDYCGNIHTFTEMLRDLLSLGNVRRVWCLMILLIFLPLSFPNLKKMTWKCVRIVRTN